MTIERSGQLLSSKTPLYENTSGNLLIIKTFIFHNPTTTDANFILHFIPNDQGLIGTPATQNIYWNVILKGKESYEISPAMPLILLNLGDSLQANSSIDNSVNFLLMGREFTDSSSVDSILRIGQLSTLPQVIFENPQNSIIYIKTILLHNTSEDNVIFQIYRVQNDQGAIGSPITSNQYFEVELAGKETFEISPSMPFTFRLQNDSIQAKASVDATINYMLLGAN